MLATHTLLQRYCSHYMAIRVITAGLGCKGDFHCLSLVDGIVSNHQSLCWNLIHGVITMEMLAETRLIGWGYYHNTSVKPFRRLAFSFEHIIAYCFSLSLDLFL